MTTPSIEELISAWIDGELDPATRERVRNEIASSPSLQELERSLRELSGQIRKLPSMKPGNDLSASILCRLDRKPVPVSVAANGQSARGSGTRRSRAWLRISAGIMTTAAAVVIAVVLWNPAVFTEAWNVAASGSPAPASESVANRPEDAIVVDSAAAPPVAMKDPGMELGAPAPDSPSSKTADPSRQIAAADSDVGAMARESKQGLVEGNFSAGGIDSAQAGVQGERFNQKVDNLKKLEVLDEQKQSVAGAQLGTGFSDPGKAAVPRPNAPPGSAAPGDDRGLARSGGNAPTNPTAQNKTETDSGIDRKEMAALQIDASAAESRSAENRGANPGIQPRMLEKSSENLGSLAQSAMANAGSSSAGSGLGESGQVSPDADLAANINAQNFFYSVQVPAQGDSWKRVAESISGQKDGAQPIPGNERVQDVYVFEGTNAGWNALIERIKSAEKDIAISAIEMPIPEPELFGLLQSVEDLKRADRSAGMDARQQADRTMELRLETKQAGGLEVGGEMSLYYLGRVVEQERGQSFGEAAGGQGGQLAGGQTLNRSRGMAGEAGAGAAGGAGAGAGAGGGGGFRAGERESQSASGVVTDTAQADKTLGAGIAADKSVGQSQAEHFIPNETEKIVGKNTEPPVRRYLILSVAPKRLESLPSAADIK